MAHIPFPSDTLPTPQMWFRKHVFSERDYVTLSIFYVAERVYEGKLFPRVVRCTMFGTLLFPQEELTGPDIETGQMLLDAHFQKRFAEHQCNDGCIPWHTDGRNDPSTGEKPVNRTIQ